MPDFKVLEKRLAALGRPLASREDLVSRADVLGLYQEVVDALNRDLAQYEQLKRIALIPAEFSVMGGELTPSLKVRRSVVEQRWGGRDRADVRANRKGELSSSPSSSFVLSIAIRRFVRWGVATTATGPCR